MYNEIMPGLTVDGGGQLALGGCRLTELAAEYGTPVYVLDERTLLDNCRAFTGAMARCYGENFTIAYASKALACKEIYRMMAREGMGIDVVSGSELYTALAAGFPADRVYFHGNYKTAGEISYGLEVGVRRFVVDNLEELRTLNELAGQRGRRVDIAVRLTPDRKSTRLNSSH